MYAEMSPETMVRRLESGRRASDLLREEMVEIFLEYETQSGRILRRACEVASGFLNQEGSWSLDLQEAMDVARRGAEGHEARAVALSASRARWRRCSADRLAAEKRAASLCAKCVEADAEFWQQRRRRRRDSKEEKLKLREIARLRDAAKRRAGRAYGERLEDRRRESRQILQAVGARLEIIPSSSSDEDVERADRDRLFTAALRVLDWDWSRRTRLSSEESDAAGKKEPTEPSSVPPDLFSSSDGAWASATPTQRLEALAIAGSRRLSHSLGRREAGRGAACLGYVISNDEASLVHRALVLASTFDYRGTFLSSFPRVRNAVERRNEDPTFPDDLLVASLAAELDSSSALAPTQWDDPTTCTDAQLAEAVATIHALLFAKIPAIAYDISLATGEKDDDDRFRRDFVKAAAERAQLPHFLTCQLLPKNSDLVNTNNAPDNSQKNY